MILKHLEFGVDGFAGWEWVCACWQPLQYFNLYQWVIERIEREALDYLPTDVQCSG